MQAGLRTPGGHEENRLWLRIGRLARRDSVALLTLLAVIAVSFALTSLLVSLYRNKRASLGQHWYAQGQADLRAGRATEAVEDFRNALAYQPDDFARQFALAQALAATGRSAEANSYFLALWQQEPQSGPVNINLARWAASQHRTNEVIRYYHNASFGVWPANEEQERQSARQELIQYLLRNGAYQQADSELLAQAQELAPTAAAHADSGRDLLAAGDEGHALGEFRTALRFDPDDAGALAGAGEAAYRMANYGLAHRYLARAAVRLPSDHTVANLLATVTLVLDADPFAYHLSRQDRRARVLTDVGTALRRLQSCGATPAAAQPSAHALLNPLLATSNLLAAGRARRQFFRDANAIPNAMAFVFQVEEVTTRLCGPPADADLALLLLARARESTAP